MRLSRLQKFILTHCYGSKSKTCLKTEFYNYYSKKELKKDKLGIQVALQKSIDNLVFKDLTAAYGHKTMKKWYIHKVRLTAKGKRIAKDLIKSRQRKLPIK